MKLVQNLIIIGLVLLSTNAYADLNSALAALKALDYNDAFKELLPLANQGNAEAQYHLGVLYKYGVPQDDKKAMMWYQKAAKQGNADAQNSLGDIYNQGFIVPQGNNKAIMWHQEYKKAMMWYQKAAKQGNADAEDSLGRMYEAGNGVPQDNKKAMMWYQKAAKQGNPLAQDSLGRMYEFGKGVPQDYVQAAILYQESATNGECSFSCIDGVYDLGRMYEFGKGVPQDYTQAAVLFRKAASASFIPDTRAEYELGVLYENGQGVPQGYEQAATWYQKAATDKSLPSVEAQIKLGDLFSQGRGVQQDYAQAIAWYQKAADKGNAVAKKDLANLMLDTEKQANATSSQAKLVNLNCSLDGFNPIAGGVHLEKVFTVDYTNSTVNGYPASISETLISWDKTFNGNTIHDSINRLSGFYNSSSDQFPSLWTGHCTPGYQQF